MAAQVGDPKLVAVERAGLVAEPEVVGGHCGRTDVGRIDERHAVPAAVLQYQLADAGEVAGVAVETAERLFNALVVGGPDGVLLGAERPPQFFGSVVGERTPHGRSQHHGQQLRHAALVFEMHAGFFLEPRAVEDGREVAAVVNLRGGRKERGGGFVPLEARAHGQQVADTERLRLPRPIAGQEIGHRLLHALYIPVVDGTPHQQRHHALGHRERIAPKCVGIAVPILFQHDFAVFDHQVGRGFVPGKGRLHRVGNAGRGHAGRIRPRLRVAGQHYGAAEQRIMVYLGNAVTQGRQNVVVARHHRKHDHARPRQNRQANGGDNPNTSFHDIYLYTGYA